MAQKLLVGDKDTVLMIPAFEINGVPQLVLPTGGVVVPFTAPTAALLNYWIGVKTPADAGAHWGGNVTCAIVDDWSLMMTDSATDNTKTLCSVGQSQALTFYNYDAKMKFLRDINPADTTSEFNLPRTLTRAPDAQYMIAHRIGYSRTATTAIGQEWNLYYAWTDEPIPASADNAYQTIGEDFIPKGIVNFKYVLVA